MLMFFWTILLASFYKINDSIYNLLLILYIFLWTYFLFFIISLSHNKVYLNKNSIVVKYQFFNKRRLWKDIIKIEFKSKKVVLIAHNGKKLKLDWRWKNHKEISINIYQLIINKNTNCEIEEDFLAYVKGSKRIVG